MSGATRWAAVIIVGIAAVFVFLQFGPAQNPAAAQQSAKRSASAPPPMFGPWYAAALRDVISLEAFDVARLEKQLLTTPDDFAARLKVMAYYLRGDRQSRPGDKAKRVGHVFWLVEHHPDSELLQSPFAQIVDGSLDPEQTRRLAALWDAATKSRPADAAVQWNAAGFVAGDGLRHMQLLEAAAAADPNHSYALRPLAHLYAISIFEGAPLAARAEAALEASKNVWVLGNAAYMLQSQYNQALQGGRKIPRVAELAERYFLRAKALDPNLDRAAILPQIDLQAIALAREAEERARWLDQEFWAQAAITKIRRLPVQAFPSLPPAVAGVLRDRKCTVPQPASVLAIAKPAPENVIRGEFFVKGEAGWAVLCSVNYATSLLVFRNDKDTKPEMIGNSGSDEGYLQGLGDDVGYSRLISPVSRDFIMNHYRAYGGPEPPPIDHHGIDDAFMGKASTTWYFHDNKWLPLMGAD